MREMVRLSEASRQAAEALAVFDYAALERLAARLDAASSGEVQVAWESAESIQTNQRILAGVLMATEQNLALLHRLRERKVSDEWVL